MQGFEIVGHAIVSSDGMIAAADGSMPEALKVEADYRAFQRALDEAALVVLGRLGHERHRNPGRLRLVLTSGVTGLAPDPDDSNALFWNPAQDRLAAALEFLGIDEGTLAIVGGQRVFDLFAPFFTGFELAECPDFAIPGGIACFSAGPPRQVLIANGLEPGEPEILDVARGVTSTTWRRTT